MKFSHRYRILYVSLALLFSLILVSCQTSCTREKPDDNPTPQTEQDRPILSVSDLRDNDYEELTKLVYEFLVTGKLDAENLPKYVRKLKETLRMILTISEDDKTAKKYFYDLKLMKLRPINDKNKLTLPLGDNLKLRVDYVQSETEIQNFNMKHEYDFIYGYYALKLEKDDFTGYYLPEELISLDMIDDESSEMNVKRFFNYLEKTPQYTESIAFVENLKSFIASKCRIKSFYYDGKNDYQLVKGFRHFKDYNRDDLEYSFKIAADYLINMVNSDGKFAYNFNPGRDYVSKSYNILRHCGTIYAMLEVFEITKDKELLAAIKRATDYAVRQMKDYDENTICIVEDDELKLGGNGLAAIALSKYIEQTGDNKYLEKLKKIGKWFQLIQEENGKFKFHKQIYSTREIIDEPCAYYPGEALLGIMRIYEHTKDETLVQTAVKGAQYIINIRDKDMTLENTYHDHWLLYALNEIHRQEPHPEFLEKSKLIVKSMLMSMNKSPLTPEIIGSYYKNPRSTPTATRTEGILAAYKLFKYTEYEGLASDALDAIKLSIGYELRTQFRPENCLFFATPKNAVGGFQRGPMDYSIRIDYVQHNISAIVNFYKILKGMK